MASLSAVKGMRIYITKTAAGRRKEAMVNRTAKKVFHNDVKTLAEQTHRKARDYAPKDTGRLRDKIHLEKVPTGEGIEMWKVQSKNPIPGAPQGYRRAGNTGNFDLAYWAHKSSRAAAHFHNKDRYLFKAEEWAERKKDEYVRSGTYKRKFKQFKR